MARLKKEENSWEGIAKVLVLYPGAGNLYLDGGGRGPAGLVQKKKLRF